MFVRCRLLNPIRFARREHKRSKPGWFWLAFSVGGARASGERSSAASLPELASLLLFLAMSGEVGKERKRKTLEDKKKGQEREKLIVVLYLCALFPRQKKKSRAMNHFFQISQAQESKANSHYAKWV